MNFFCSIAIIFFICVVSLYYGDTVDEFEHAKDIWNSTHGEIVFAAVVFRHGDRFPLEYLPGTNPSKNEQLKDSEKGKLTKKGKNRAYRLGRWMRARYDHLVNNQEYSSDVLNMLSSRMERTIMSGQLFLAGFYPPIHDEKEKWNENILWQPIPLYPLPYPDRLIAIQEYCARFNLEMERVKNHPEVWEFYEKHKGIMEYIDVHSNESLHRDFKEIDPFIESILMSAYVYDVLHVQDQLGWKIPDWAMKIYPQDREKIQSMAFKLRTYNHEMKRLKGGPILNHIITELKTKRNKPQSERLFQFYSGHDGSIITLLNTLGIWNGDLPDYSAALLFELRKFGAKWIITISYRITEGAPLLLLEIPNCPKPCTLDNFIAVTKPLIPEDWDTECQIFKPDYNRIT